MVAIHAVFAHGCAITKHTCATMIRTAISIFALALVSSAALAQTELPQEFVTCSRIQNNGERLACYDRAVAYLSQPADRQSVAPSAEASFGLQAGAPQPAPSAATQKEESHEVSSITARITEIGSDREGRKVVTLDNGQTWRELSKSTYVSLEVGDEVTISRAAFGSFRMSTTSGRPLRVRRVE